MVESFRGETWLEEIIGVCPRRESWSLPDALVPFQMLQHEDFQPCAPTKMNSLTIGLKAMKPTDHGLKLLISRSQVNFSSF
jgi:hypothetical protein